MTLVLGIHAGATALLTGLIWLVQIEVYPGFSWVEPARFPHFHQFHCRRISWLVVPLMLTELATAAVLLLLGRSLYPLSWQVPSLLLLGLIWGSTFLVQVPLHGQLSKGFDPGVCGQLVRSNWVRTLAWSGRTLIVMFFLIQLLQE